jgi:hypothetical protein
VLLILSPTVWVDIVHKSEKAAVEKQLKEVTTSIQAAEMQIVDLQKQIATGTSLSKQDRTKSKEMETAIAARQLEKDGLIRKRIEATAAMPQPIFPLKNPGLFSMAAAFLVGILLSILLPEKEAEAKYAEQKVREYIGIGAE